MIPTGISDTRLPEIRAIECEPSRRAAVHLEAALHSAWRNTAIQIFSFDIRDPALIDAVILAGIPSR
jgi:hypothetical protein